MSRSCWPAERSWRAAIDELRGGCGGRSSLRPASWKHWPGSAFRHRRTAYHHPEGNSYIERFHRSLEEARSSIARWIEEYDHDWPHRGIENRTPREAFLDFTAVLNSETLTA